MLLLLWSLPGRIPSRRMWVKVWGNTGIWEHKASGKEKQRQNPEGMGSQGASEDGDTSSGCPKMCSVAGPLCPGTAQYLPATSECCIDLNPLSLQQHQPILVFTHIWDFKSIKDSTNWSFLCTWKLGNSFFGLFCLCNIGYQSRVKVSKAIELASVLPSLSL